MRLATAVGLAALSGVACFAIAHHAPVWRPYVEVFTSPAPRSLPIPLQGGASHALADTWGADRAGGRSHQGIDIFARRGTPVVSPVTGFVLGWGQDALGGNVVRILGSGGQVHYFAHLERFGDVRRWQLVRPGDVVGYVGNTGNARTTPPHLHYGIYARGRAINPYPLLVAVQRRR